jgi:hypothetical protein
MKWVEKMFKDSNTLSQMWDSTTKKTKFQHHVILKVATLSTTRILKTRFDILTMPQVGNFHSTSTWPPLDLHSGGDKA